MKINYFCFLLLYSFSFSTQKLDRFLKNKKLNSAVLGLFFAGLKLSQGEEKKDKGLEKFDTNYFKKLSKESAFAATKDLLSEDIALKIVQETFNDKPLDISSFDKNYSTSLNFLNLLFSVKNAKLPEIKKEKTNYKLISISILNGLLPIISEKIINKYFDEKGKKYHFNKFIAIYMSNFLTNFINEISINYCLKNNGNETQIVDIFNLGKNIIPSGFSIYNLRDVSN